jgi:hypothetical protein
LRATLIEWNDFPFALDALLEFLPDFVGGLLRNGAGSEKEDKYD